MTFEIVRTTSCLTDRPEILSSLLIRQGESPSAPEYTQITGFRLIIPASCDGSRPRRRF